MASKKKSTESTSDAFISAASEFSSFLDSLAVDSDSRHEQIKTLDEYKDVIKSYLDRIKKRQLDIPEGFSKERVRQFFTRKAQGDTGDGINMLGGIIMANLCRDRLREMARDKKNPYKEVAQKRISEFFSRDFVEQFADALPFRGNTDDRGTGILRRGNQAKTKKGTTEEDEEEYSTGSYTKFLNELFSLTQGKFSWRSEILAPVSNDLQCLRAMGLPDCAESAVELHNNGLIKYTR